MKIIIFLIAVIVAGYVYDRGYSYVAIFLVSVAAWEAFIEGWRHAFRKSWRADYVLYKETFAARL
jgi:hypothetical protein